MCRDTWLVLVTCIYSSHIGWWIKQENIMIFLLDCGVRASVGQLFEVFSFFLSPPYYFSYYCILIYWFLQLLFSPKSSLLRLVCLPSPVKLSFPISLSVSSSSFLATVTAASTLPLSLCFSYYWHNPSAASHPICLLCFPLLPLPGSPSLLTLIVCLSCTVLCSPPAPGPDVRPSEPQTSWRCPPPRSHSSTSRRDTWKTLASPMATCLVSLWSTVIILYN